VRIYLCDDNPQYRQLARLVLAEDHEIVGEGGDGDEVVRDASEARPDLVLLDLNMPRVPGYEALPPLRAALPDAKIVILTSGRAENEQAAAIRAGADGFIAKPESIFALPAEIARVLDEGGPSARD
jgi:two-component system NarL family response regulator